jgi:ATP-dependent exoDNAse (exonuclease V) beta subunit
MNDQALQGVLQTGPRQPADAAVRAQALDPAQSFIVQAPAGSGKTELLIRRLLVLLASVDAPEEIVALTFTRKAAGEMRARVIEALERAADDTPPDSAHERDTWTLARAALARDAACGWQLAATPGRLRIQTIDGLCAMLVRRLPLLSRLGGMPALEDEPEPLYREAARATLGLLEDGTPEQSAAVATLLLHLDNRSGAVENLLVTMLAKRDQWLRHVAQPVATGDRALLEAALGRVRREAFAQVAALAGPVGGRLVTLAAWAADNLPPDSDARLAACRGLAALPGEDDAAAAHWLGLADLLLTKSGEWRKAANAAIGFPPPSGATDAALKRRLEQAKREFADLMADCARVDGLCDALAALGTLPPARYDDTQWEVLSAVLAVLRLAAAQLDLVFAARGACDFTAVAQGAREALGTAEAPSDLLLSLDARIRHLLIDEFQDTSLSQFDLLLRLTAGWSAGDGRTLFLVGDPMQSIYRFREAEVGLFLRARRHGVGALRPVPLRLSTNFRSTRGVVEWVNAAFAQVLPAHEDVARGAVPFEPATVWHEDAAGARPAVTMHALIDADPTHEAQRVVEVVRQARSADTQASIAVLVRGRAHLAQIVPALRTAGVALRAVEIEPLRERPVVLDLLALTRALRHPADRIAWLAVLRAPWCGLTLADLHVLAGDAGHRPLWSLLADGERRARLSDDGRARVEALIAALAPAIDGARRASLRDAVEGAWLRLGGADCLRAPRDLDDAHAYLDLLAAVEQAADVADLDDLDARMDKLFAAPDPLAADLRPVEVMTIHKAKGLEWDVVIVPGLQRRPGSGDTPLLLWAELPRAAADDAADDARDDTELADLVLATVGATGAARDPVHAWIGRRERERERLETGRLLYVAATRAARHLHLFGTAATAERKGGIELATPGADTLLGALWPAVQRTFESAFAQRTAQAAQAATDAAAPADASADASAVDPRLWRLPPAALPQPDDPRLGTLAWRADAPPDSARMPVPFSWAGETVRLVGTVVHRWLQRIAGDLPAWPVERIDALAPHLERDLATAGVPAAERAAAVQRAAQALKNTLTDARGRWLLMPRTADAQAVSELKLTGLDAGGLVNVAIDRSFIDGGVRWIVDYKTGTHEGAGIEAFLDAEVERYRDQLARYARLMAALGPQPVRCALYFPLLSAWRELDPDAGDGSTS